MNKGLFTENQVAKRRKKKEDISSPMKKLFHELGNILN